MSSYVSASLQRRIRAQFCDCCAYCHTAEGLNVSTFEIEHIIPRSAGGQTILDNLCLACPTCNRCKSDRVAIVDPSTGQRIPLFHPQHDAWSSHFAWSANGVELVALSDIGKVTIAALRMNRPQLLRVRRMWVAMNEHPPATD